VSDTKPASSAGSKPAVPPPPPERSPEQIKADIAAGQQRLAETVDDLNERLSPQSLARDAVDRVKSTFIDEYGSPKPKPIAIAAGVVVGLVVLRGLFGRD
jgi:hypothetical protein